MEFFFVRHGESAANAAGLYAGTADSPLTAKGRAQAHLAARELAGEPIAWVASSPLSRAYDTAVEVARPHGLDVVVDDRLREHCKGALEGTAFRKVGSRGWAQVPGAETAEELAARTMDVLSELAARPGRGVVVAHAGTARAVECLRTGGDPSGLFDLAPAGNAAPYLVHLEVPART